VAAAFFAVSTQAQTPTPTQQPNTSTDGSNAAAVTTSAPAPSKWAPSMVIIAEKGYQDPTDTQLTNLDGQLHLKLGYKLDNGHKVSVNQRIFMSNAVNPQKQYLMDAVLGSLRLEYTIPNKIGAGGATVFRLGLPTTPASYDSNDLLGWAVIPSLSWELTPKLGLSYSGYLGGALYGGNRRAIPAYAIDLVNDGVENWNQARLDRMMNTNQHRRGWVYIQNGAALSLNITEKVSISQSLGYTFVMSDYSNDFSNFQNTSAGFELGTEVSFQPVKSVSLSLGVAQLLPDSGRGFSDPVTGKSSAYHQYGLYREEQTTYSLTSAITF
jgi:hypothetical protein